MDRPIPSTRPPLGLAWYAGAGLLAALVALPALLRPEARAQILALALIFGSLGALRRYLRMDHPAHVALAALLLLIPALNARLYQQLHVLDGMQWIQRGRGIAEELAWLSRDRVSTAPFLLGAAAGLALLCRAAGPLGRPRWGPLLCLGGAGLGAVAARPMLGPLLEALAQARYGEVQLWASLIALLPLLALPGLALTWRAGTSRAERLLALLLAVGCMAAGGHALPGLVLATPAHPQGPELPEAEVGPTVHLPALDPRQAEELARLGGAPPGQPPWVCPRPSRKPFAQWSRAHAVLRLPADLPLEEAELVFDLLRERWIGGAHLLGRASAPPGLLQSWLEAPTSEVVLDRPPGEIEWQPLLSAEPRRGQLCGLAPERQATLGQLYHQARSLRQGGCSLVLLHPAGAPPAPCPG